ncbi:MAG TPA: ABC transporter permease, partial [Gemmatimonadales bacterium]|nr:ABC transporter permease [Gemmatimonadales bacterium]
MQSFLQDLRQALRLARRAPLTSLVVVLTLGLAIGANTAIFSVVRATFLLRLPYANADRVVDISSDNLERGWTQFGVSQPDFLDWRAEAKAFDGISAYWGGRGNLTGTDAPARIRFATVSTDIFHTLGATPALGRGFQVDDGEAGHTGVVVLSDGFWRRAMGGRGDVIGRQLELDGQRLTVVGVMPAGFEFPSNGYDLWVPMGNALDPHNGRGKRFLSAVGAVARGKTPQQAEAELGAIGRRLAEEYPSTNRGWSVSMQSFRGVLVAQQSPAVLAAWASVSLVLLIAGANIANLLLVRVLRRRRELAVRSALGAARARLRRQLLTESLVLAMAGTLLGLGLAAAGLRWISALAPQGLPGADHIGLDPLALAYTVVLMLVIGVGFGTYPALRTLRADLAASLRSGDRADVAGGSRRLRDVLVVAELGIAAMVLVGAGLTIRSMRRLLQEDPGFQTAGRLTLTLAPARNAMPERARAVQYFDEVLQAAASVPGIRRVGAINVLPVGGTWWMTSFFPEGE